MDVVSALAESCAAAAVTATCSLEGGPSSVFPSCAGACPSGIVMIAFSTGGAGTGDLVSTSCLPSSSASFSSLAVKAALFSSPARSAFSALSAPLPGRRGDGGGSCPCVCRSNKRSGGAGGGGGSKALHSDDVTAEINAIECPETVDETCARDGCEDEVGDSHNVVTAVLLLLFATLIVVATMVVLVVVLVAVIVAGLRGGARRIT